MFAKKKMPAIIKESKPKISHVFLLPSKLYKIGPVIVPRILPNAQNNANRAEAFSFAPGRVPILSFTL